MIRVTMFCLGLAALAALSVSLTPSDAPAADAPKAGAGSAGQRVFELRTYFTLPGRLDALNKRFREHTCRIFQKHGIEVVGFWTPKDEKDKLVYIIAFPSREAAKASWDAFHADPEWKKVAAESEKDGKIVMKVDSVYMDPTDYSPIK